MTDNSRLLLRLVKFYVLDTNTDLYHLELSVVQLYVCCYSCEGFQRSTKIHKKKKKIFQSFRSCGNLAVVRNVDTVSTALTGEERVTFNPRNYAWRITVKCRTQVIQDKNKSYQTNKCFQETFSILSRTASFI